MAQVVESLPCKPEALRSNPNTAKRRAGEKERKSYHYLWQYLHGDEKLLVKSYKYQIRRGKGKEQISSMVIDSLEQ
jgi:hypothetical protein